MTPTAFVTLTIDDCDFLTTKTLLAIAKKENIKLTFFVPTAYIGKLLNKRQVTSWNDLSIAQKQGHEIGSHGINHWLPDTFTHRLERGFLNFIHDPGFDFIISRLKYITQSTTYPPKFYSLEHELTGSKKEIDHKVLVSCISFSAPGGVVSPNIIRATKWADYQFLRTSKAGLNQLATFSPFNLKAMTWDKHTTAHQANLWAIQAHKTNSWLIETLHIVENNPYSTYGAQLSELIKHITFLKNLPIFIDTLANNGSKFIALKRQMETNHFDIEADHKTWFLNTRSFMLLNQSISLLPPRPKILNIGCGDGADLFSIKKSLGNKPAQFLGTDISQTKCDSTSKLLHCPTLRCDARQIPKPDRSFDLIVDTTTIAFIENDFAYLREIHRLLKTKGLLHITVVLRSKYGIYLYRNSGQFVLDPSQTTIYSDPKQFKQLLKHTGFMILKEHVSLVKYPLVDYLVRLLSLFNVNLTKDPLFFQKHTTMNKIRQKILIRVPGFKNYDLVAQKI